MSLFNNALYEFSHVCKAPPPETRGAPDIGWWISFQPDTISDSINSHRPNATSHTGARTQTDSKTQPPSIPSPPDHSLRSTSRDHSKPNYGRGCLMGGPGAARSHLHRVARSGSGTCARTTAPPHRASLGPRTPGPSSQHHFISAPALLRRAGCFARAQNNCSDI